ncbi:MAG: hypothetical protein WCB36_05755 [Burkholderiales bacterium]
MPLQIKKHDKFPADKIRAMHGCSFSVTAADNQPVSAEAECLAIESRASS